MIDPTGVSGLAEGRGGNGSLRTTRTARSNCGCRSNYIFNAGIVEDPDDHSEGAGPAGPADAHRRPEELPHPGRPQDETGGHRRARHRRRSGLRGTGVQPVGGREPLPPRLAARHVRRVPHRASRCGEHRQEGRANKGALIAWAWLRAYAGPGSPGSPAVGVPQPLAGTGSHGIAVGARVASVPQLASRRRASAEGEPGSAW